MALYRDSIKKAAKVCLILFLLIVLTPDKGDAGEVKKIQDNSFLIEEAYNQEYRVLQHIQTFMHMNDNTWLYTFTHEWPINGQKHQLSYTIPFLGVLTPVNGIELMDPNALIQDIASPGNPGVINGLGDILINYRYQLIFEKAIAFSPRVSFILPTGDYKKGLGSGALGYQINLPLSIDLSDRWTTHFNSGLTYIPNSKEPGGASANTLGFNYGASIIYCASQDFNLMLEAVGTSFEAVQPDGTLERGNTFLINPGFRFAINSKSGLQIVPGISFPIGLGQSKGQNGIFTYLSFEHPF